MTTQSPLEPRQPGDDALARAARRLAEAPNLQLSEDARNRIEARLRARTLELYANRPPQRRRRVFRGLARVAAALALVLALTLFGVTQASAGSLPGDTLYPVKRAVESGRLALVSDAGEPGLRVALAGRRIDEFHSLLNRQQVHLHSLEESNDHMDRALILVEAGHGSAVQVRQDIVTLAARQTAVIARALSQASPTDAARLRTIQTATFTLSQRAVLGLTPATPAPTPTVTATFTPTPTVTATFTPTPTPTATFTPTPTPTPTITFTPEDQPRDGGTASDDPTRTPPGHGATPGLGDNPPGQGGTHPGIGNDGKPPGQDRDKPDKKDR